MADADVLATTERLVIRPWRPAEADRMYDMLRRLEVARWIGGRPMRDRHEALALIDRYTTRLACDPRFGYWAVVEREAAAPAADRPVASPAGTVVLKAVPDGDGEVEIGWHLHPDSWGRGLATEAGRAVLAHAFAVGLSEVWAVTHPENQTSAGVCRKLGMRLLGVTHRW